ncbi:UNVERIFIED_CONTAM: Trc8 [Trichonephila clavipes]
MTQIYSDSSLVSRFLLIEIDKSVVKIYQVTCGGFVMAIILITRRAHHLIAFYLSVAALGVVVWSYILNVEYVKYCSELLFEHSSLQHELFGLNKKAVQVFFSCYLSQSFLSIVFCFSTMNILDFTCKKFMVGVLFLFPTLINAALPSTVLMVAPDFVAVAIFGILMWHFMRHLPNLMNHLRLFVTPWNYSFSFVRFLNVFAFYWTNIKIPIVFRTYAVIRLIKNIMFLFYDYIFIEYYEMGIFHFNSEQLFHVFKQITLMSFENFVALCGITSLLAYIVDKSINDVVQKFLMIPNAEQNSIFRMFSQLLMLLSVQFGVTSLESEERYKMIFSISWMMGISVLSKINAQICHKLVSLSIMGNVSYNNHARALTVAFLTLIISSTWLTFIFNSYVSETWLFPVTIFNIEILISLTISLVIYALNLIHYHCCTEWYELYDYIYYLQSLKSIVTLVLSVVVFAKGFYKLFESGSILRLLFLFVHFYHNVWCQIVLGWGLLKKRKLIYDCVNSLPIASTEEVTEMGGCCVICLNDVAKHIVCVTRCNHFFHSYCLRKWLNERRTCPICHRIILTLINTDVEETVRARERRRVHTR